MERFQLDQLQVEIKGNRPQSGNRPQYHEFLRHISMSAGIYVLPPGSEDPQGPHNQDELYYVLSGSAVIEVGGEQKPVSPNSAVFIPAHVKHKFFDIEEEMTLLVIFSPAEDSNS